MTRELRCTAGHVVGVRQAGVYTGLVVIRCAGRSIAVREQGIVAVLCECGQSWEPTMARLPLDDIEIKAPTLAVGRR